MFVLIALFILLTVYVAVSNMEKEAKTPYYIFATVVTVFLLIGVIF